MIGLGTPLDIGFGTPEGVVPALPPTAAAADDDDNAVPPVAPAAAESDGRKSSISLEELPAKGLATRPVEGNWCCSIIILLYPAQYNAIA